MTNVIAFKEQPPRQHTCAFCGKTESQVMRMIKSETGYCVCNECVAVCKKRIADERKQSPLE